MKRRYLALGYRAIYVLLRDYGIGDGDSKRTCDGYSSPVATRWQRRWAWRGLATRNATMPAKDP